MQAIIFSHENGGSYVMDRNGCFRFVRGHTSTPIGTEIEISQQQPVSMMRILSAAACFVLVAFIGIFTWLWNVTDYYVYVDINPSVELTFNGLGRLGNSAALNDDGSMLLSGLGLRGAADKVVVSLIDAAMEKNFLSDTSGEPHVFVTVIAARGGKTDSMISSINKALQEHGMQEYTVVETGSMELRERAGVLGVSPGRLKLAEAFMSGAGSEMDLEEVMRIPLGELFAAANNHKGATGAAIFEDSDPDDGLNGDQSPVNIDNNGNKDNQDSGIPTGNGEDDPQDEDPLDVGTIGNTSPAPGASYTDPQPSGQQPGDQQPGDQQPDDQKPGDQQPGDQQPGDQQPGDQQPGDQQPGDQQPGDQQPGDQQPGDQQPGNQQPGDPPPGDPPPGDPPPGNPPPYNPPPTPPPTDPPPTDPPPDGEHGDDCDCPICAGESGEGFGAEVYAIVTDKGNQRKVTITLIDLFGQYTQEFDYANGTTEFTYKIEGVHFDYRVYIRFSGNAVETVLIVGFESNEGEIFGATVTAFVEGTGVSRNVVITVTDEDGDHEKTFVYVNGTKSEVYVVEGITRIYKVYIIYQGNEVDIALIFDYEDEAGEDG